MNSGLEAWRRDWSSRLSARGFGVAFLRELSNGLQAEVTDGSRSCRVNLYHSARRGPSAVFSGGDRDLFSILSCDEGSLPTGGSDEAGKGDYFGPLTAAAVALEPASAARLRSMGLADSKLLDSRRIFMLEEAIGAETRARAVASIQPAEYNAAMKAMQAGRNSLDILAGLHASAIAGMLENCRGTCPPRVVIDRFCAPSRVAPLLPRGVEYEFRVRGEQEPAVAAASILARAAYLHALSVLSSELGVEVKSGAGADIDAIGAAVVAGHGPEALFRSAKTHFANTARILSRQGIDPVR
ncbi:MAG TPA: hypothetical protein P5266_05880 [Candidatus Fermentibacter sp.]|nr:hypothetical protein [Candidatus Fermentibacter sp.]